MTPKEKAKELVEKFYSKYNNVRKDKSFSQEQKRMALITVDEIIKTFVDLSNGEFTFIYQVEYWQELKSEIQKL